MTKSTSVTRTKQFCVKDIGFFKNELEVQANVPLAEDIVLQGSFNGGLLKDFEGDKTFNIADHFFLGRTEDRDITTV